MPFTFSPDPTAMAISSCAQFIPENSSVKQLVELGGTGITTLPQVYVTRDPVITATEIIAEEEIPVINYSLLTNRTSNERSKIIADIGRACTEWGCFKIVNHGVAEGLCTAMLDVFIGFFEQTEEEKRQYSGRKILEPINYGTSFNTVEDVRYWRDFLRVMVQPTFKCPAKPLKFRTTSEEYTRCMREIFIELLRAVWESLGLPESCMEESVEQKSCSQLLFGNLYPPCPQPELAMGLPPHSDTSTLTILMQSQAVAALQVMHDGKWVPIEHTPNSFFVNVGDVIEIASNGIYKSVLHRVMLLNNKSTRLSVLSVFGPPLETVVAPLPHLIDSVSRPAAYRAIKFRELIEIDQPNQLGKSTLDHIRL